MSCIFCSIIRGDAPCSELYRDERVLAFMDIQPVNPGHALVIPLAHGAMLADLDLEDGAQIFRVGQKLAAALRASPRRADGVNLFLADGVVAGQEVHHVHLHVFPRYADDGFGLVQGPDYQTLPPRGELDSIASELRAKL